MWYHVKQILIFFYIFANVRITVFVLQVKKNKRVKIRYTYMYR